MNRADLLASLWTDAAGAPDALSQIEFPDEEIVQPSSFRVDALAQVSTAAAALAAAELWRLRGGEPQRVSVGSRAAAAEFRSERHVSVAGSPPAELWDPIAGAYPTADGFVRLHTNFAHHRDGVLALLGCGNDRAQVAAALEGWEAEPFESRATEAGLVVAAMRSFSAWDAHPQADAVAARPLVAITRIGEAPPQPWPASPRPLAGLRVLELTRIIAGPVCGRVLASHGADVLRLIGPDVPTIGALDADTGRGKRSAVVDLREAAGRGRLEDLARGADVFLQSYRPGALAGRGFGPAAVAALRPGIVYASLTAYGRDGPWGGKRGFDSLVQTATGLNHAEAAAAGSPLPKPLPCQALDHGSGQLLAFGIMMALARRAREGGSWHVEVSLAGVSRWLRRQGRVEAGLSRPDPTPADIEPFRETAASGYGALRAVRPAAILARTPARYDRPSVPFGTDAPEWLAP